MHHIDTDEPYARALDRICMHGAGLTTYAGPPRAPLLNRKQPRRLSDVLHAYAHERIWSSL